MNLEAIDQKHLWHPFTQQKTARSPIPIDRAEGAYLFIKDGRRLIDAISSWWVTLHGHCEPHIAQAIAKQAETLEHVIFAGVTHPGAVKLAERLIPLLPGDMERVFFSDNGSTAVEVGLKMAIQKAHNEGKKGGRIVAFRGAYHGDTFGAMSVSGRSLFTQAFSDFMFPVEYIDAPIRGVRSRSCIKQLQALLEKDDAVLALIYEPMVQGAGGMLMQDENSLNDLLRCAKEAGVICIADEVMTGFGRTGKLFASDYCEEKPDVICLAKGLTGGVLPLSITACTADIYEPFHDSDLSKAFFHGHSFTANPLGCAAALASLDLVEAESFLSNVERIASKHCDFVDRCQRSDRRGSILEARSLGTILALDLRSDEKTGYSNSLREKVMPFFVEKGVLLRPLGNTVYVLPPLCVTNEDLDVVYESIESFIRTLNHE